MNMLELTIAISRHSNGRFQDCKQEGSLTPHHTVCLQQTVKLHLYYDTKRTLMECETNLI